MAPASTRRRSVADPLSPGMDIDWQHPLPQTMALAWEEVTGAAIPPPEPAASVQLRCRHGGNLAPARRHPLDRVRARQPDGSRTPATSAWRWTVILGAAKGLAACAMRWCEVAGTRRTRGGPDRDAGSKASSSPTALERALRDSLATRNVEEIGAVKGFLEHLNRTSWGKVATGSAGRQAARPRTG